MFLFPVFLDIRDKHCLVIGGGPVAQRKTLNLLECQARVKVVSPSITGVLKGLAQQGDIDWQQRDYVREDLEGVFLAFAATNDTKANQQILNQCRQQGILVNVVDNPEDCDFFVPSVIRRQSLSIAISTSGKSPLLARRLREELEEQIPAEYGEWVEIMGRIREYIKTKVVDTQKRQSLYRYLAETDMWEIIKNGQEDIIRERIDKCISSWRA